MHAALASIAGGLTPAGREIILNRVDAAANHDATAFVSAEVSRSLSGSRSVRGGQALIVTSCRRPRTKSRGENE